MRLDRPVMKVIISVQNVSLSIRTEHQHRRSSKRSDITRYSCALQCLLKAFGMLLKIMHASLD
jgi:hypothetical protein